MYAGIYLCMQYGCIYAGIYVTCIYFSVYSKSDVDIIAWEGCALEEAHSTQPARTFPHT